MPHQRCLLPRIINTQSDLAALGHLGQSPVHSGAQRHKAQPGRGWASCRMAPSLDIKDSVDQSLRKLQECIQGRSIWYDVYVHVHAHMYGSMHLLYLHIYIRELNISIHTYTHQHTYVWIHGLHITSRVCSAHHMYVSVCACAYVWTIHCTGWLHDRLQTSSLGDRV